MNMKEQIILFISHCHAAIGRFIQRVHAVYFSICIALWSLPQAVLRAEDLEGVLGRAGRNVSSVGQFVTILAAGAGLIMIVIGLFKFTTAKRDRSGYGEAITFTVIGSLLLALLTFTGMLSESTFSGNEAKSGLDELRL